MEQPQMIEISGNAKNIDVHHNPNNVQKFLPEHCTNSMSSILYPCQTFASIPIRAYHKDLKG
jgi:hypothetical protein